MESNTSGAVAGAVAGGVVVLLTQIANRVWDVLAARGERKQQWEDSIFRASLEVRSNIETAFSMQGAIRVGTRPNASERVATTLDKELDHFLLRLYDPFLHAAGVKGLVPIALRPLLCRLAACGDAVRRIQIYAGTWLGSDLKPDVVGNNLDVLLQTHLLTFISVFCSTASPAVRQTWSRTEVTRLVTSMTELGVPWRSWLGSWDMIQDCADIPYAKELISDLNR